MCKNCGGTCTPTENGEKERTCTRCGASETVKAGEGGKPILFSTTDDHTGIALTVTVPYERSGAVVTQITAEEPVTYTSSNPKLVDMDEDGNVTLKRLSIFQKSVTITATAEGGTASTCEVDIEVRWWQYIIWLLLGSFWF